MISLSRSASSTGDSSSIVTFDRSGVIRDYLYDRDENGEYFFGIPKGNKIGVYLLTSAENLYEYLAEESEGFSLIAERRKTEFFKTTCNLWKDVI